jgi:hypothetical protein
LLGTITLRAAAYEQAFSPADTSSVLSTNVGVDHAQSGAEGRRIVWLKMRGGIQSRRLLFQTYRAWACRDCVLVIDGYEQLSSIARGAALLLTRFSSAGILVTSHKATRLPTLVETLADVELAQELLDDLLPEDLPERAEFLEAERLRSLLDKHHGNLREVFMELYDEFVEAP